MQRIFVKHYLLIQNPGCDNETGTLAGFVP